MSHTKEELTPICLRLFNDVKAALSPELADRLVSSRAVRNHGSYRTVLLFNVWDRFQSDVFPKQHFCYSLGYDPHHLISGGSSWYFHLWLNTIRIYRERIAVKEVLEAQLREVCPRGFKFSTDDRAAQAKVNFEWNNPLSDLPEFLVPQYTRLIEATHPVLMPLIDKYSVYARPDVKAEVAARGRIAHQPVRIARPELVEEYSRSIPPTWRKEILDKHGFKCVHCGVDLSLGDFHMDHIVPFTKGGKRIKSNFQPLCPPCNEKKGNRFVG